MGLAEEGDDVGRDGGADALDVVELVIGGTFGILGRDHGLAPGCQRAVVAREEARGGVPDLRDAEGIDEAFEGDAAARLDGVHQLRHRLPAPALALLERGLALAQTEDIGRSLQPPLLPELVDGLVAEAVDVEGVAADEMLQALDRLRRADEAAGAAP